MRVRELFSILLCGCYSQLSLSMHKNKRGLKIPAVVLKPQPSIKKRNSCGANFVAMSRDKCTLQSVCGQLSGKPWPRANEGTHLHIPSMG